MVLPWHKIPVKSNKIGLFFYSLLVLLFVITFVRAQLGAHPKLAEYWKFIPQPFGLNPPHQTIVHRYNS